MLHGCKNLIASRRASIATALEYSKWQRGSVCASCAHLCVLCCSELLVLSCVEAHRASDAKKIATFHEHKNQLNYGFLIYASLTTILCSLLPIQTSGCCLRSVRFTGRNGFNFTCRKMEDIESSTNYVLLLFG